MRKQKSFEEQLLMAQENLNQAQLKVKECESKISDINQQIEERNMREAYAVMKQNNVSVEDLRKILAQKRESKTDKTKRPLNTA